MPCKDLAVRGSLKGTNLAPEAFDELIKMLTDLKTEIVASKTTEDTADAFDQVIWQH